MEELILGGTYIRLEICVTKSIGLAYSWKGSKKSCHRTVFPLIYFVFEGSFQV